MSGDPIVIQLVTEVLDSGLSPEEVCIACPQHLPEVRRRVARCRELDSRLDVLFSPATEITDAQESPAAARLPQIPLYEVQAFIGQGGMGVVYSAKHLKLKRLVALKMIRSGAYASPAELERFSLEAEAVAGLHHPNIVQIFDLGEVDGQPYFTMEYLDGGSLAQKLAGAPLPPAQAAGYLVTLATAMAAAHRAGIVHRDLKPANVLFSSDGSLKISDFGVARRMTVDDELTFGGARIGTPSYMAPEQAAGRTAAIGPPADIYALGAILYEMLTGRPPFRGASAAETERQVINDDPAPPRQLNTSVPRDLETICLKCLRKDTPDRYLTAADLAADAERYLRGEPIHARPIGALERAIKWTRRRPAQTISITASLILTLGLCGGALWFLSVRSARTRSASASLDQVDVLKQQGKWEEARTELKQVNFELGNHGPRELRQRLDSDNRDLDLVTKLEAIELRLASVLGNLSQIEIEDAFRPIFKDAGLELFTRDTDAAKRQIQSSPIRVAIAEAMNDWAVANQDPNQISWLLDVGNASSDNLNKTKTQWEQQLRDPKIWLDREALGKIATCAPIDQEPASTLVPVGRFLLLLNDRKNPLGILFLMKVQRQYPTDFWANLVLGQAKFKAEDYEDAIRYFQAAVSLRPTEPIPEANLAYALLEEGRDDEGLAHCQIALNLGSSADVVEINVNTLALRNSLEKLGEVSREHQAAMAKAGPNAPPHNLETLRQLSGVSNAMMNDYSLAFGAEAMGRLETRWQKWKVSLDANPPDYKTWGGYAELCLYLHHDDEYRRTRTRLLERFGDTTDPHTAERLGRACLLLPASDEETRKAVTLIDRAVHADKSKVESWAPDFFQVAKALAEFRQGHREQASKILHGPPYQALKPMPQFIMAMILQQQGRTEEARRTYADAVGMFDWNPNRATNADAWMFQVLRRQAEEVIKPSSRPFLKQPSTTENHSGQTP